MRDPKDDYIHGRDLKTNFVKHWPKKDFEVRDGKVYRKGEDKVLGIADESVLTEESTQALREIAESQNKANNSNNSNEENKMSNEENKSADNTASTATTTEKETKMENTTNASEAKEQIKDTFKGIFLTETLRQKALSLWGYVWRYFAWICVLVVALCVMGVATHFALAYIAGLGLGEVATVVLKLVVLALQLAGIFLVSRVVAKNFVELDLRRYYGRIMEKSELNAQQAAAAAV